MCLIATFYAAFFASDEHRLAIYIAIVVSAIGGAVVLWGIPWRRVIASRWREHAFFAWSISSLATIAVTAALDGGVGSPLALMLFLPAVFVLGSRTWLPAMSRPLSLKVSLANELHDSLVGYFNKARFGRTRPLQAMPGRRRR